MVRSRGFFLYALFLWVIACCLFPAALRADPATGLSGLVRDTDGKLLPGAVVRISRGRLTAFATANADGVYSFTGLPPASGYVLRATLKRYDAAEQGGITLTAGVIVRADFALKPQRSQPSGAIGGTVLTTGGAPISGARVEVLDGASDARTSTDRLGRFRLKGLKAGNYDLSITAETHATKLVQGVEVRVQQTTEVRTTLDEPDASAPGSLFGAVRDAAGHALPGATVEIVSGPGTGSTTAGEEGRYQLTELPEGTYSVRASAEGFWSNVWEGIMVHPGREVRVDFALRSDETHSQFGSITGRVSDPSNHAIAGAVVEVTTGPTIRRTETNSEGRYTLAELQAGGYGVRAGKSGFQSRSREVQVTAGAASTLDFVLEPAAAEDGTIRGRVTDVENHPLAGVVVQVVGGAQAITNSEGRYALEHLAPGDYTLRASKDGFRTATAEHVVVTAGAITERNFVLERPAAVTGRITGIVTDPDHHPLQGALVQILEGPSATTGADGHYALENLLPGEYRLRVTREGFQPATEDHVVVTAGASTEQNFTLQRVPPAPAKIVGHVRGGDAALAGAKVRIVEGPVQKEVLTNADGAYELADLPAGSYRLSVSKEGWKTVESETIVLSAGQVRELNFTLQRQTGQ